MISVANSPSSFDERHEIARLINEYSDIFTGLGKLKGFRVKLHMDETVQLVAQPHQRIPFQVHKQPERQLDGDEENGVIWKVEGLTPWVSLVVAAPKPKTRKYLHVRPHAPGHPGSSKRTTYHAYY